MDDKYDRDTPHEARPLEWPHAAEWLRAHPVFGSVPPEALERPPIGGDGPLRYVPSGDEPGYASKHRSVPARVADQIDNDLMATALRVAASFRRDPDAARWQAQTILRCLGGGEYVTTVRIQNLAKLELLPDPPRPAGDAMRSDDV